MGMLALSPTTGIAITGLTSPTYTYVQDKPPNARSSQYAVTALGGTQTGVEVSSVSNPFTFTWEQPTQYRTLGQPNPVTGVISNVPVNTSKLRVRKGMDVDGAGLIKVGMAEIHFKIPAGADINDTVSIRALISSLGGVLEENADGIAASLINGYFAE